MSTGGFTPIKNGLFTKKHGEKLGEAWVLFGKYCSYANAPMSKKDKDRGEACVFIYPKTIQKQLDIDSETWRSWHANLENEGYISTHHLANSEAVTVCIRKALL